MPSDEAIANRQKSMAILAAAPVETLTRAFENYADIPAHDIVRAPEIGLVMARGRMGGTGAPFNLGEVSVTRCVIRLKTGEAGSSYIMGRDKKKALQAAIFDALWQNPAHHETIETTVLAPLAAAQEEERQNVRAETAATKVDFFTMVRGED
ncbi:MAG: phosphonate C-P lyase system protein PhnG [Rhodobacteraceae bacterium]|nr:phosphonate C-P lyase system protein PhnG [Paracoccaceae bacterium]